MHNYTIDGDIRTKITVNITIISVIILFIFSLILNNFGVKSLPLPININNQIILKLCFGLFKISAIFGALYAIFNNWLWKNKYIKKKRVA